MTELDYRKLALRLYSEITRSHPLNERLADPLRDALVSAFDAGASGRYEPVSDCFRYREKM